MVYDKEKLSAFSSAVKRETDSKIEQLKREVEEYEKAELEKVREDQYNRMFTYMQDQVQIIKSKYRQSITKFELESKRNLFVYRNQLTEQVFEQVQKRLLDFTKTADYQDFLLKQIQAAMKEFPCQTGVILLAKEDMSLANQIKTAISNVTTVEADSKNHLGGFTIVNREQGLVADKTFQTALEEEKQQFYRTCGLRINF